MVNPTFKIALETGTDYSDTGMMHVWHISDYVRLRRMGLPVEGIEIENYMDENTMCYNEDLEAFMEENDIHPEWMENGS